MTIRRPRYSKEEFARRGNALYKSQVRQHVEEGNYGKIVAIDIDTGAFEVADNTIAATDKLYERCPDAQPWVIRIGHRTVYRFGSKKPFPEAKLEDVAGYLAYSGKPKTIEEMNAAIDQGFQEQWHDSCEHELQ